MRNSPYNCTKILPVIIPCMLLFSCMARYPAATTTMAHLQQNKKEAKLTPQDFQDEFSKLIKNKTGVLAYPELIGNFYERKNYQPVLVPKFLPGGQLEVLLDHLNHSTQHGLAVELFAANSLKKELTETTSRNSTNALKIHRDLMQLELAVANSLIRYSLALQFGITDPEKVYTNYSTPTLKPDSNAVIRILEVKNLKNYLDSLQPKDKVYLALQKELIKVPDVGNDQDENLKKLMVNLERLRWKNRPTDQRFVQVNIANYTLDVMDKGKSILHMKVCVGEPGDHETPQLGSAIYSVQVNPVWNIPQSIANNEISQRAAEDRYYLANNNITVSRRGKLIENPETIDWSTANISDFSFQQQPGAENALGKIKFLFPNKSSVYLHDTPIQSAFNLKMRAVSHGCVRVERPLELAYTLFGKGEKYNQIRKAMQSGYPRAKYIELPKSVPVRLAYYTAWTDPAGKLRFYDDVYGLDKALYAAMGKVE